MKKWLLTVGVFIGVLALSAGLMFIVGCCMVPSLDEGSHGLAVPLMLGYLGLVYGTPVALISSVVWLVWRSRREKEEAKFILNAIDEAGMKRE